MKKILIVMLTLFLTLQAESYRDHDGKKGKRQKTLVTNGEVHANNVQAIVSNNGWLFWGGGASGFVIPSPVHSNNINTATIFASGLWLVGTVNGEQRAAIANYRTDFVPGLWSEYQIDNTVYGPDNPDYQIYYYYSDRQIEYLNNLLNEDDHTDGQKIHAYAQAELDKANSFNSSWNAKAVIQGAPVNPPGDVAAFTVYHDADINHRSENLVNQSNDPLNIQIKMLVFSFRSELTAINNSVFVKMDFINKNSLPITDMYVSVWSDPDVGIYSDDLVGSDPSLGLGYAYNGSNGDAQYSDILGIAPPAVGYDYFQGPIIDQIGSQIAQRSSNNSDFISYVNVDEKYNPEPNDVIIQDKYIRPATGFFYYDNGDEASNASEYYNIAQNRFAATGEFSSAQANFLSENPELDESVVDWMYGGDPESGTGWLDQNPNDRRFLLNNGPFNLAVSNGNEDFNDAGHNSVVFGVYTSFGSNNLSSVTRLKYDNNLIQTAYNRAFSVSDDMQQVEADVFYQNQQFVINLNTKYDSDNFIENYYYEGHDIEGFQIAEFNPDDNSYNIIATIDKINNIRNVKNLYSDEDGDLVEKVVVRGNDTGLIGSLAFDNNTPSWQTHYFAVRAYAVNLDASTGVRVLFSPFNHLNPINAISDDETNLTSEYGSKIDFTHIGDDSDGSLDVVVTNPYEVTGALYTVRFEKREDALYFEGYGENDSIPAGTVVWYLEKDGQRVSIEFNGQYTSDWAFPQSYSDEGFNYEMYYDGLKIFVDDIRSGFKHFSIISNSNGELNPPDMAAFAFNSNGFPLYNNSDRPDGSRQQSNGSSWGIHTSTYWMNEPENPSFANFVGDVGYYMGGHPAGPVPQLPGGNGIHHAKNNIFEIRFTEAGGKAALRDANNIRLIVDVPFELWNIGPDAEDTSDDYRMAAFFRDHDSNHMWNIRNVDHSVSGGDNDPATEGIFFLDPTNKSPGQAGYDEFFSAAIADSVNDFNNSITQFPYAYNSAYHTVGFNSLALVNWNGGSVADESFPANLNATMPEIGSVFRISMQSGNSENSIMRFNGPGEAQPFVKHRLYGNLLYAGSLEPVIQYNPRIFLASDTNIRKYARYENEAFDGMYDFQVRENEDYYLIIGGGGQQGFYRSFNVEYEDDDNDRDGRYLERRNAGLTSLDLVLMTRHVLMKDTLDSPYKRLAADVNQDGNITANDITTVQQFILGNINTFYNTWTDSINDSTEIEINDSTIWYVFPEDYEFENEENPTHEWRHFFTNVVNISEDTEINYIGGRFGDVNLSRKSIPDEHHYEDEENYKLKTIPLEIELSSITDKENINVPVNMNAYKGLNGFSFTLKWNPEEIEFSKLNIQNQFGLNSKNFNTSRVSEGLLSILWFDYSGESKDLDALSELFNIDFKKISDKVSSIKMTSDISPMSASNDLYQDVKIISTELMLDRGELELPKSFALEQNYPNPFNPVTNIRFSVPKKSLVSLKIYNTLGKLVLSHDQTYEAGVQTFTWDGTNHSGRKVASGVYYYRMNAGKFTEVKKMILIK